MAKNNIERPDLDKKNDDRVTTEVSNVTPLDCDEPIVTRWELWSYYCKCHMIEISRCLCNVSNPRSQCTITAVLCVPSDFVLIQRRLLKLSRSREFPFVCPLWFLELV